MSYLLDANVFIEARRRYYGFDFCPAFWEWLLAANERGVVFSIEKVRDQLIGSGDELEDWVRTLDASFFLLRTRGRCEALPRQSNGAVAKRIASRRSRRLPVTPMRTSLLTPPRRVPRS